MLASQVVNRQDLGKSLNHARCVVLVPRGDWPAQHEVQVWTPESLLQVRRLTVAKELRIGHSVAGGRGRPIRRTVWRVERAERG